MKNLSARVQALEQHFGAGDDGEVLDLISKINDPEVRAELARRVAGGIGSANMLNVADILLYAHDHQGEETEETEEVTIQ